MILIPSNEKLLLKIWYGVGQDILRAEQPFVGGNLAQHFSSVRGGQQYLGGGRLAHAVLDRFLRLTLVIELDPFWIPVECRLVYRSEQFGHGGADFFLFVRSFIIDWKSSQR